MNTPPGSVGAKVAELARAEGPARAFSRDTYARAWELVVGWASSASDGGDGLPCPGNPMGTIDYALDVAELYEIALEARLAKSEGIRQFEEKERAALAMHETAGERRARAELEADAKKRGA